MRIRTTFEVEMEPVKVVYGRISRREIRQLSRKLHADFLNYTIKQPSKGEMARGVAALRIVVFYRMRIRYPRT